MVGTTRTDHTTCNPLTMWNRKVVFIAKPGGEHTGIGRYVQMLYGKLLKAGVDTVCIAPEMPPFPNFGYLLLRRFGIDLYTFLNNYPVWAQYPQADVYHLTNQNLATLLHFRRPTKRIIVTVHDIIPYMLRHDPHLSTYRNVVYRLFDYMAMTGLKRADRLVTVSQYTKQCLVEHLGIAPEKIEVIYPGIDHERFRPLSVPAAIRERYHLPAGRRYIIYVGSEDPRKNLVILVHALAQVRRQLPDVELVKVGRAHFDGERRRLIELAAQLGVRTAIHFLEDIPEDDLPLLYNLADVCVLPSYYEGFGFPVLEAMACGTPVVCANAASLSEVNGNIGLLFEHGPVAVENLTEALLRVLTDPDLAQTMRAKGPAHAATFRWSYTVRQLLNTYQDEAADQQTQINRKTLRAHIVERSLDLLLDPRLPHAAPYNLWRLWHYAPPKSLPRLEGPLHICLTFDIEHDFRNPVSAASSERFLARYIEWAHRCGWPGTLYVQGDLLPSLADLLHKAREEHELGLHGLHHEVWGRSRWWHYRLGLVGLPEAEKLARLLEALELFKSVRLERPRSFRAPYLNADRTTLKLLAQNGFTSDSSPTAYFGAVPVPYQHNNIWQIPVTANPRPEWHLRGARYHELTLGTMLSRPAEQIMATISMAVHLQQLYRTRLPPHLVLLAHPWEFESTPGVAHSSSVNWECLERIVNMITAMYPAVFATISELTSHDAEN